MNTIAEVTPMTKPTAHGDRNWAPEQEHIFAGDWFKCAKCEGEAHVDSTPLPGDLCSACAALLDKEAS